MAQAATIPADRRFFELLMRRYNQRIYRAVRSLLARPKRRRRCRRATPRPVRIAVNEALGRLWRRGRQERWLASADWDNEQELPLAGAAPRGPEEEVMGRELVAVLEAAVDRLPAHDRGGPP